MPKPRPPAGLFTNMDYTFTNEKGEHEKVTQERWGWAVIYKDGTELKQFGDDGIFNRFASIKQDEVAMLIMYRPDDLSKRIDMPIAEGQQLQLFHFYRNLRLNIGTAEEYSTRVYVFGWKCKTTGATSYNYILSDDRLVTASCDIDISKHNP